MTAVVDMVVNAYRKERVHSDATPVLHYVLRVSGGLFPKILSDVLDMFPDIDMGYHGNVDVTDGFGDDVNVYANLVRRFEPHSITHIPYDFVNHPDARGLLSFHPYHLMSLRYIGPDAIRAAVILEVCPFLTSDSIDKAIEKYPELATRDCNAGYNHSLREFLDYDDDHEYGENIIATAYVREDIIAVASELKTMRGLRRAISVLNVMWK